jgi:hypothetical protein
MVKRLIPVLAVFALVALLLSGLPAQPAEADPDWWDTDWQYRMKLTFGNSASGVDLIDFPVLVHLTSTYSDFWDNINSGITTDDTKDLRFVDDDAMELYFEAEKIDYASEDAVIWVNVLLIDAGSTTDFIYVYYGNSAATESAYHSPSDVWDGNFMMVQHMNEDPSGTVPQMKDSTSNGNDGTSSGSMTSGDQVAGQIDGSLDFDGSNDSVTVPDDDTLDLAGGLTIEAWINIDTWGNWDDIVFKGQGTASNSDYQFALVSSGLAWDGTLAGTWRTKYFNTSQDTGTWIYAVVTHDTSTVKCYRAGSEISSQSDAGTIHVSDYQLGISQEGAAASGYLDGKIDEIHISDIARSDDWIEAQYLSMTDAFITFGVEEEAPPPPPRRGVGGEVYPINKAAVLAPWLGLTLVLILAIGGGILALRRRRTQ